MQLLVICILCISTPAVAVDAKSLFKDHKNNIYQIRVIELASGNKSTIGSGFLISENGHIATNYHVVSLFINKPDRYRLEYVDHNGSIGKLKAIDIDVIHDLAITQTESSNKQHFKLNEEALFKGTRIYSMGNPHDLGMSIIEGTYNGLLEKTLYDKIFFSGSLNPGMSGGPALNENGEVIGVIVSTAGNQLSFLVPAAYLSSLYQEALDRTSPLSDFNARIEKQLSDHQKSYLQQILDSKWPTNQLGHAILPGKINEIFKCWGDSEQREEALVEHSFSNCRSEDRLFLANRYTTGGISYTYDLYTKKDISSLHFYNIYNKHFGRSIHVGSARKEDVTNYQCNTDFITVAGQDWKTALCTRNHIKFKSLYDISLLMAQVSDNDQGLIVRLGISGISKAMSLKFVERFLGELQWQK